MALILERQAGERVRVGRDVTFEIVEIRGKRVRVAIEAPDGVIILREELVNRKERRE